MGRRQRKPFPESRWEPHCLWSGGLTTVECVNGEFRESDGMSQLQRERGFHDKQGGSLDQAGGNCLAEGPHPLPSLHKRPFSNARRDSYIIKG